ncbi:vesicular inhibitory amino acid transporter-like [Asterias rubens]|uniref:vesicular inhibitory amino acid transporter-like n=1 Tax=Asterias rubens TaxID=7604 RepID=UPI001455A032|nr:vesicular inhibitory amino acid transporter-like [Asterias rubens]
MSSYSPIPGLGAPVARIRNFVGGLLPRGRLDEEHLHFAKCDSTELSVLGPGEDEAVLTKQGGAEKGKVPAVNGAVAPGWNQQAASAAGQRGGYGEGSNVNIVKKQISTWDAGWNVTNAIQGMFLVALPYAVLHGGYWGLLALVTAAAVTCYTGKILVECLYVTDDVTGLRVRVRESYVDIAKEVWGDRFAAQIVHTAQFIELIMTCILYLVLCGDLLSNSFPTDKMDETAWTMLATFLVVPCAFLRDLKAVSCLSFGNAIVHLVVNAILIGFCISCAASWHWSDVAVHVDIHYFPVSMGIVIFSYTSHIFLPSLEGSMIERNKFNKMLYWTHGLAGFFKALFAYLCYLSFGPGTRDIITDNLPTQGFRAIVNVVLVIKALLSYPLPFYAAVELLERAFFSGRPRTVFPSCYALDGYLNVWAVALRTLVVVFSMLLAIVIPHFNLLMGLIGSFTGTMLSFVWPCWFHLSIKWHEIPWYQKLFNICVILSGFAVGLIGIIYSFEALLKTYRTEL